jgi:hypothetical protein
MSAKTNTVSTIVGFAAAAAIFAPSSRLLESDKSTPALPPPVERERVVHFGPDAGYVFCPIFGLNFAVGGGCEE